MSEQFFTGQSPVKEINKKHSLTELFGWFVPMPKLKDLWDFPRPCLLCGAAVYKPDMHRVWHDKTV